MNEHDEIGSRIRWLCRVQRTVWVMGLLAMWTTAAARDAASTWARYANIQFKLDSKDADAEIRITFEGRRSHSYIGTDSAKMNPSEPTMALGSLDSALHEFGHALSLEHEHQNPEG